MEDKTRAQLEAELVENQTQLAEVEALLKEDPENDEVLALRNELRDLITLTEHYIEIKKKDAEKKQEEERAKIDLANAYVSPLALNATVAPPQSKPKVTSIPSGFYVGLECEAMWSGDGNWYPCVIEAINEEDGTIGVKFIGYGDEETVPADKVRLMDLAPGARHKRKEPDIKALLENGQIPKHLQILPTDSESVRKAKKRRLKALKLKAKIQAAEESGLAQKASWQSFTQKVSKKRKLGGTVFCYFLMYYPYLTYPLSIVISRKESIFKSPDTVEGKVGVVGSGKGMTQSATQVVVKKKLPSGIIDAKEIDAMAPPPTAPPMPYSYPMQYPSSGWNSYPSSK